MIIIQKYFSNKEKWAAFAEYVQKCVALVVQTLSHRDDDGRLPRDAQSLDGLKKGLDTLNSYLPKAPFPFPHLYVTLHFSAIDEIKSEIERRQGANFMKRVGNLLKDPDQIIEFQTKLDRAMAFFHVRAMR